MESTNVNTLYRSGFHSSFIDAKSLSKESQALRFLWWGFAIVETLLFTRIILGYLDANMISPLTSLMYTISDYILYPFTTTLTSAGGGGSYAWITIVAIIGYFVFTITLVGLIKASRSPQSRIEHARALSRRKYSH